MSQRTSVDVIDELLQNMETKDSSSTVKMDAKPLIFALPEDLIRFICVHCEYQTIVQGIHCCCKALHEITKQFLKSNYYIYRLHITNYPTNDVLQQKPLKIVQIKYFNQYKHLLSRFNKNKLTESNNKESSYDPCKRCKIGLCSWFSKYLSAEPSGNVMCNRPYMDEWEYFVSIPISQNKIGLQSWHNKFVSAQSDGKLQVNKDKLLEYEEFSVHQQKNGKFAFKSCCFDKYISAQPNGCIQVNRDKALKWEQFAVHIIDDLNYNNNNNQNILDHRLPISYILLRYNRYYDVDNKNTTTNFRKWLHRNWNNGNIFAVGCGTVTIFDQFMQSMHEQNKMMLTLNNTVKLLRLTNRAEPQPNNDQNRLCNALSIIKRYNISTNPVAVAPNVYGLDIGFHLGDNTKQKYLKQHFIPYLNVLNNLRFIILHGCHKQNKLKLKLKAKDDEEQIDLFEDTLKALINIIYIDFSCFCAKLKGRNNDNIDNNDDEKYDGMHSLMFPTSVECINFGYRFELHNDTMMKIENIAELKKLKLIYIELNPKEKKMPIRFIGEFMNCSSLDTVAINLAGLVWENLSVEQTVYLENISKCWRIERKQRINKLNVIVITTQDGVHSGFKKIINDCYGNNEMVDIVYLDCTAGLKWLFEYVTNNIGSNDFMFRKLWRVYHFSRSNFSPLDVNMYQ